MLRRDRADELYVIAVKRYREEYPDRELDEKFLDSLWFSIYGNLIADGEEAAEEYVKNGNFGNEIRIQSKKWRIIAWQIIAVKS